MQIKCDKHHVYTVDGERAHISVTELLAKHGLAPNLSKVPESVLKAKAENGTQIHADLENILNKPKYEPQTMHGENFKRWVYENVDCAVGEQKLAFDIGGMLLCGTADVIGYLKSGERFVADHKTTAKFEREYVSWQVSVLDYFARYCDGRIVNGKEWHWNGATRFFCFWYDKDGGLEVKELEQVPDSEIEKLLMAEFHGEKYQRPQLVVDGELQAQFERAELILCQAEQSYKQAKETAEKLRESLKTEMERQHIKSFETDRVKLTYIEPMERFSVDSTKLRREFPQIYQRVVKVTPVQSSVRIKIKDDDDYDDLP